MTAEKTVWLENFFLKRSGYYVPTPIFSEGFYDAQKTLFGQDTPYYITKYLMVFKGVDLYGYFPEQELLNIVDATIKIIQEDPAQVEKNHQETYCFNDQYFAFGKKVVATDLSKLSDSELVQHFQKLIDLQQKSHAHSCITTWFVDSVGETFSKLLLNQTKEIVKKSGQEIDFAQAFTTLTTLPQNSMGLDEDLDALQLLKKISQDQQATKIFLNLKDFSQIPNELNDELKKLIQAHYEKWRWTAFVYMGPAHEIDYCLTILTGLLKQKLDLDQEIAKIKNRPSEVKKQRDELIKDLKMTADQKRLFDIAADIVFLKGYRKDCFFFGSYALSFILKEMAKRLYFSLNQMYTLTHKEVSAIFLQGLKISPQELNARKGLTIVRGGQKGEIEVITGSEAQKIFSQLNIKKEKIDTSVTKLHGTCACSGKAEGIVKIVNTIKEIAKMKEGDIMVAHSTFPSLVPAMKKAAAIITEDGGITCHAAIVSRELQTPCITGIKAATTILKDGTKVEVDAGEGMVKIVK